MLAITDDSIAGDAMREIGEESANCDDEVSGAERLIVAKIKIYVTNANDTAQRDAF